MPYAELWTKTTASKEIASFYLNKFGHFLKWKHYKETILEVGCAEGTITKEFLFPFVKNHVRKLVAIDKLDDMIDCAKKDNTIKEIDFQVMDAMDKESVAKRANQFDHIFSTMLAHWIPDNRTYLTHLHRMLKPGGQVFQTQLTNEQVLRKSFQKQFDEGTWSKYVPNDPVFPDYTDEPVKYVRNLFQEIGFEIECCEMQDDVSIIENFGDFLKPLFYIYKHLDSIPKELHEEFFQYHIRNSRGFCIYRGEPDKYEYHYQTLICIASKAK